MIQNAIFGPMLSLMLLTLLVWIYLYLRRIPFIRASNLSDEELRPLEFQRLSPPTVSNPSDNLKNLFELPVLFYALCLYLFVTAQVDAAYLTAAWVFVAFRALHSVVHCTVNHVMTRFSLYAIASLGLWFMLVRACWAFLVA